MDAIIEKQRPLETLEYSLSSVLQHNTPEDLWMIIYNKIYNITTFSTDHPGGVEVLYDCGGVDATEAFEDVAHSDDALNMLAPYFVGDVMLLEQKKYNKLRVPVALEMKPVAAEAAPTWKNRRRKRKLKKMLERMAFYSLVVFAFIGISLCIGLQKVKWVNLVTDVESEAVTWSFS